MAVRRDPLAPGRQDRRRDPQLARRPLPLPALSDRPSARHRRRRGRDLPRRRQRSRPAGKHADRQRQDLHRPLRRRPQRLRIPAAAARHPPEERIPRPPPDTGQDRALPPNPETLARQPGQLPAPSPSCNANSTSSASTTTSNAPTAPSSAERPARPTAPPPKPRPPPTAPPRTTTACATTDWTPPAG